MKRSSCFVMKIMHVGIIICFAFLICVDSWSVEKYTVNGNDYKSKTQDPCTSHTCGNGGTCKIEGGKAECICVAPYSGEHCETDPCTSYTCRNGGTCKFEGNKAKCTCVAPYSGEHCETDPCTSHSCQNGGTCQLHGDEAKCICAAPYSGDNCETVDYCASNPCKNGGICRNDEDAYNCTCGEFYGGKTCEDIIWCDTYGKEKCGDAKCVNDKGLKTGICECEENHFFNKTSKTCDVDHCLPNPCKNGGNCTNDENTYNCTCLDYYEGKDCLVNTWCEKLGQEICGDEKCEYNAKTGKGECICEDEKIFDETIRKCIVDYCAEKPCKNDGVCRNDEDTYYHCNCTGVYAGQMCEDIIWCEINNGTGICGEATCVDDKILATGYCACDDYKTFNNISRRCEDMSGCFPRLLSGECSKSNEICNDKTGNCDCKANYKYNSKNSDKECVANFCALKKCGSNAKCIELGLGETMCICNEGYFMGNSGCIKIDLCSVKYCTQNCTLGVCSCFSGFDLDSDNVTCKTGKDTTECDSDCGVVGTCVKSGEESKCVCPMPSFVSKDKKCVDYCTAYKKPPPYTCPTTECEATNDAKGFRCKCKLPYVLHEDGVHCKRKQMCIESNVLQKCGEQAALCRENLTSAEGYDCYCDDGFEMEDGVCMRKCDIKANRDKCAALNAICELDDEMAVKCNCPPMLKRKGDGPCDTIAPNSYLGKLSVMKSLYELKDSRRSKRSLKIVNLPKLRRDMSESLKEVYDGLDDLKILDCDDDGNVLVCSIEMQLPNKPDVVNKIASPTVCVPINKEFCIAGNSLILKKAEDGEDLFKKTKACDPEVTSRLCEKATICTTSNDVEFQCRCRKGFDSIGSFKPISNSKSFVERCNDIDECAISKCPNTTYCKNSFGDYDCFCKDKHKKKREDSDLKKEGCEPLCSPSPCVNGTCVIVGNHGFSCKCEESFTGVFCNETIPGKPMDQRTAAIVGGVLGTLLVIVLIAGYMFYRKVQNDKEENDDYAKHRQRGILTEMTRPGRRQNDRDNDIELHGGNRNSRFARQDSGEYRRGFQEERMIPRVQTSKGRDEILDDRNAASDPEMSRRPGQRELREEQRNPRNVSKMQFRNRGYEEE